MFYKKQGSSSVFVVCICVIMIGAGFLLGYLFTSYSLNTIFNETEFSLKNQIEELKSLQKEPIKIAPPKEKVPVVPTPTSTPDDDANTTADGIDDPPSLDDKINTILDNLVDSQSPPTPVTDNTEDDIIQTGPDDNTVDDSNIVGDNTSMDSNTEPTDDEIDNVSGSTDEKIKPKYLFKIHEDKLAVFDYTNNQLGDLIRVINVDVAFLSQSDQVILKKGLIIDSEEALIGLLEDYTS